MARCHDRRRSGPETFLLTSADQIPAEAVSEVVEHAVPVLLWGSRANGGNGLTSSRGGDIYRSDLSHLGVNVEAGVSQLGDLLGEELHSLRGVAEDYGLVDLELETRADISDRCDVRGNTC